MLLHFNQSHRGRNNCTSSIKLTVPFIYFEYTHVHHNDDNYPLCKSHFLGLKLWQRVGDWSPTHLRRWWYFLESMSCHRTWRRDTEELSISERLVSAGNWNECPPLNTFYSIIFCIKWRRSIIVSPCLTISVKRGRKIVRKIARQTIPDNFHKTIITI